MSYTATIGLEVHAELKTKSKMFCGCKNEPHGVDPNAHICPVCLAHPGTLPVPNEQAIEMVLLFGQAVGATAASYSEFDRKNYFYPDIPKAYQISQYAFPFLAGGKLEGVELTRVHLEEDTARSQHDKGVSSLVDFNRAGVPLMELVTEPVIHDAETAGRFARELQLLLRTLDISAANMERGEMRVEANISVSKQSDVLGTKVEVKNINSFKAVESAIDYEIKNQIALLEGGATIKQETKGWDENRSRTFTQRSKETAKDYRYFPDPDLSKMDISQHALFEPTLLAEKMSILPSEKRLSYKNLDLPIDTIEIIIADKELDEKLAQLIAKGAEGKLLKLSANYLTSDITALILTGEYKLSELKMDHFLDLMTLLQENKIGSRVAKDLLPDLFKVDKKPSEIAAERGLLQVSDVKSLQPVVDEIIVENALVADEYKSGKDAAMQFLLGQGMKKTKGSADPNALRKLLDSSLR